ncbi:glycine zipper 2TM domain-containing protein [Chiayiivirga flava]|uniref:Outer membrane lipoprotein SlyB n=1 Tax=Chiayiivirga flava TaxID=659595 RepID=A0A7W8D368_9GAMM|nr:glycine zipper 2TM domain-containing protein [Chiayiivirga flava]MBB5206622.1 outer membrane lipoprotein SlyB [Chiayiivirga flava]
MTTTRFLFVSFLALLLTACASGGGYSRSSYPERGYNSGRYDGYARCYDCGTVERIDRTYGERTSSGGGAILGGIVGGVLGNQVGGGSGRKAATVAGAIAGGVAGNAIEKNNNAAAMYELFVRMDDGRRIVVDQRDLNGIREGSYVKVSGGRARLL